MADGREHRLAYASWPYPNLFAQATAQGRARTALAAALVDSPGWNDPFSPEPSPTDYVTRETNQFLSLQFDLNFFFFFAGRAELEARAGGNPSWNTGVDYKKQLALSIDYGKVQALYQQASLSLDADLEMLNNAPRIVANPAAVNYLSQNIIFNGDIEIPVLTLHTTDDDIVPVQDEQAYAAVVASASHSSHILTAYPALDTALEGIRIEIDDYVVKPADIGSMIRTIERKLSA